MAEEGNADRLEPRQLRYVLALAELRSVRRAASFLAVPPGVLSREIAGIERALGARLFQCQPRRTVPTAAGREVAELARRRLAAQGAESLETSAGGAALRVGWMDFGRGQAIQRAALAEFRAQYPGVAVQLVPAPFRDQVRDLEEGFLEAGFAPAPLREMPGLAVRVLVPEVVGTVMLPAGHRLADREALSLSDLSGFTLHSMRMDYAPEIVAGVHDGVSRGGWRGRQTVGSQQPSGVITTVACGAAWAPVPSDLVRWAPPGVALVPLADGPLMGIDLYVLWRETDPAAAAFARLVFELRDAIEAAVPRGGAPSARRPAERGGAPREPDDSLLQEILGSGLQLEAVRRRLAPALARESGELQQVVERLERAARSGRELLQGAAVAAPVRDLAAALSGLAQEMRAGSRVEVAVRRDGAPRELRCGVEEAVHRVGVEAISNALRHASPTRVAVTLEYRDDGFRLRVADDGGGADPARLEAGAADGRGGVARMRERASAAGGDLSVRGGPAGGTVVELVVPAHSAFANR
ncbi:MAG TPA: LysR substrate-binding domain-containing protein [Longimicrobiaceae bacterium]|jgi:DNA-binding transcriptional LysR family regulator/two-component sensor histidine kinase